MVKMNKFVLLSIFVALQCTAIPAFASPREDAQYLVQRSFDEASLVHADVSIRQALVKIYVRPLSGEGIHLASKDKFADILPDEIVQPYLTELTSDLVERHLKVYSQAELEFYSDLLRANEGKSYQEVFDEHFQRKFEAALEQSKSELEPPPTDDPVVVALYELTAGLSAMTDVLEVTGLHQDMAIALGYVASLTGITQEISRIEIKIDDPIVILAVKSPGVLKFSNPTVQQDFLRRYDPKKSEANTGIQFVSPPKN